MQLEQLNDRQLLVLVLLTFQPTPLTQAEMLTKLGARWERPALARELAGLVEAGWVVSAGRYRVSDERKELVARYAWRRQLLKHLPALPPKTVPTLSGSDRPARDYLTCELRTALYRADAAAFDECAANPSLKGFPVHPFDQFWAPFDPDWLGALAPSIRGHLIRHRLETRQQRPEELAYLEGELLRNPLDYSPKARASLAFSALLAGRLEIGERLATGDHPAALACLAFSRMQRGQARQAADEYGRARAALRKLTGRRKVGFDEEYGWLEGLAWIELGDWPELEKWLALEPPCQSMIRQLAEHAQGRSQANRLPAWRPRGGLESFLVALLHVWCESPPPELAAEMEYLKGQGQHWLAAEYAALLGLEPSGDEVRPLVQIYTPRAGWELALDALARLPQAPVAAPPAALRLVWHVEVYRDGTSLSIEPLEQTNSKGKGWSDGRAVALKRLLHEAPSMSHLTIADQGICSALRTRPIGFYGQVDIFFEHEAAAPFLVGHPLVFRRQTREPLRVLAVRPRLEIRPQGSDWHVRLECPVPYAIRGAELEILQFNSCERGLQAALGKGLVVPPGGQGRLYGILRDLEGQYLGDLPDDPDVALAQRLGRELRGPA